MLVQLIGGTQDRVIAQSDVPQLEVRTLFSKYEERANKRRILQARIKVGERSFSSRREFDDMVHTVNAVSTRCGGAPVF